MIEKNIKVANNALSSKFYKTNSRGISLIFLVVTIVIILILSAIVVITVVDGPLDTANEAALRTDIQAMQEKYEVAYKDALFGKLGDENLLVDSDFEEVVPDKYKDDFKADKDGLEYVGEDETVKEIAEEMGLGKTDTNIIDFITAFSTQSSVEIQVTIKEGQVADEYVYQIREKGTEEWTEYTSLEDKILIDTLKESTDYEVKVTVKQGEMEYESEIKDVSTKVVELGNLTMRLNDFAGAIYESDTWTNQSVYVTVDGMNTTYSASGANDVLDTISPSTLTNEGVSTVILKTEFGAVVKTEEYVVKIDRSNPVINEVSKDKTEETRENVVITGKAVDSLSGIVAYMFSTDENITASSSGWNVVENTRAEITQTYTVDENDTYYFYVKDEAGNVAAQEIVVDNILKDVPTKTAPTLTSTSNTVTVKVEQTDNYNLEGAKIEVTIREKGTDTWSEWVEISGTTHTFANLDMDVEYEVKTKVTNKVGNAEESEVSSVKTVKLEKPTITAPTDIVKDGVDVTIGFPSGDNITKEYSLDGITWVPVEGTSVTVRVTENNTTVYAKVTDSSGQTSGTATYEVTCIDNVEPKLQSISVTSPETGTYTAGDEVTIVATFSENITGTAPTLKVKFGDGVDREITAGTISGNTITYKYEIVGSDYGVLTSTGYTGTVTDNVGNELKVNTTELTGNEITAYTESMIRAVAETTTDAYYADEYKSKITKVIFADIINVPEGATSWDVSAAGNGSVMAYVEDDSNGGYTLTIAGNGKVFANAGSNYMFYNFTALTEIANIELFDTSKATSMQGMFQGCSSLTSIDVSNFDTSNVANMWTMFAYCGSCTIFMGLIFQKLKK